MEMVIVNTEDEVTAEKDISTVDWPNDIYRVAGIWLYNERGEVLAAQRAFDKEHSPGAWGPSAAGIVETHESYKENVLKETEEEVGILLTSESVIEGPKVLTKRNDPVRQYFMQWFFAPCNLPIEDFVLQEDEVAAVKWIIKEALLSDLEAHPDMYLDIDASILDQLPL